MNLSLFDMYTLRTIQMMHTLYIDNLTDAYIEYNSAYTTLTHVIHNSALTYIIHYIHYIHSYIHTYTLLYVHTKEEGASQ